MEAHSLSKEEIAFIGDDLGDLPALKIAGLSAAVADAHPLVKKHSHFICSRPGGKGAVREFIEFIFEAQEKWPLIETQLDLLKSSPLKV